MAEKQSNVAQRQMEQSSPLEKLSERRVYVPRADIYETPETIVILIDMPGVDEKGVDITLEKNTLSINGTVSEEEVPQHSLTYSEYILGNYHRAFTVSAEFDADRIGATVKNGTLRLVLPKAEAVKAKKISVKASN